MTPEETRVTRLSGPEMTEDEMRERTQRILATSSREKILTSTRKPLGRGRERKELGSGFEHTTYFNRASLF